MARKLLIALAILLPTALCTGAAYIVGGIQGQRELYHSRYLEERNAIDPILSSNGAFAGIQVTERSNGGVELRGAVTSEQEFGKLRGDLLLAVGQRRAEEILRGVESKPVDH